MEFNNVIKKYLSDRHISEDIQKEFNVHESEGRIVFPVYDIDGNFLYNKYRRNPLSEVGSKYTYDSGSKVALYGLHKMKDEQTILIVEGESDCLVALSHNIPAITSTGGAMSFQKEWAEYFTDKEVTICYDNDPAGASGMVKTLNIIPHAKILFLPDKPNIKDISDYVFNGGDLQTLLTTATHFNSIEEVKEDMKKRIAIYQSVYFHEEYLKQHTKVNNYTERKAFNSDRITNAKAYPIENLLDIKHNKICCLWHNEKTPSMHYYKKTNSLFCFGCGKIADSIDVYMKLNNCTFTEAVKKLQ